MKKKQWSFSLTQRSYAWGVAIILFFALLTRLYRLGDVPHGMYWDEAAIGYNGYAVLATRRDEWLEQLPISFRSFDDYKAPLAIYLNGPFTFLFGMTLFAVRLPFALAGVGAVLGMISLTRLLSKEAGAEGQSRALAVVAGVLTTFSPWHLHFSRIGFESGLALTCFIWGVYFFHKALAVSETRRQYIDAILAVLALAASMYAYHSAKVVVPLVGVGLVVGNFRSIFRRWRPFLGAGGVGFIALLPLLHNSIWGKGLARDSVLITSKGMGLWEGIGLFFQNIVAHFSPAFLMLGETTTLRHGAGQWGVLFPTTLFLVLGGFLFGLIRKNRRTYGWWFSVGLIVAGLTPAALGTEVPHANRAFLALPGFLLLAVLGLRFFLDSKLQEIVKKSIVGSLLLVYGLCVVSSFQSYYTRFASESAEAFQDGYLEAFRFILPYERGEEGKPEVQKIIFTTEYGQPYIYALFARQTSPLEYHGGSLIKYEFKDEITIGDLERESAVVVAGMEDDLLSKNDAADHIITGSDGLPRFRIYIRP